MLAALSLLATFIQGPIHFSATPISLPKGTVSITCRGITREGGVLLHDPRGKQYFLYLRGQLGEVTDPDGRGLRVTSDGEIQRLGKSEKGGQAVFRYRHGIWIQVTPPEASVGLGYAENTKGAAVTTVAEGAQAPSKVRMTVGNDSYDVNKETSEAGLTALAVSEDGAVLVASEKLTRQYFWWKPGEGSQQISMPPYGWTTNFETDAQREFVVNDAANKRPSLLISPKGNQNVDGVSSPLRGAVLHGQWIGGFEMVGNNPRAVVVRNGKAAYLDDLVSNMRELGEQAGFQGAFSSVKAIGRQNQLVAAGVITTKAGSHEALYLLMPVAQ